MLAVKSELSKKKVTKKTRSVNFIAKEEILVEPCTIKLEGTIKPTRR